VQYTAQYIDAGNMLLRHKAQTIKGGLSIFNEEEDKLDLKLSKLR
jgi:hypothetical protein